MIQKDYAVPVRQTRQAYEKSAASYDSNVSIFHEQVTHPKIILLAKRFLTSLSEKRVLDVGCGSGLLMRRLRDLGAICSGVDITRAFVDHARSSGLDVRQASMHQLPFEDSLFDLVVSNFALSYLPIEGQTVTLGEMSRVLCPNGLLVFSCMHPFLLRNPVDYFEMEREKTLFLFGQKFVVHILDWPEIINMIVASSLRVEELIDAEIPEHLEEIANQVDDDNIRKLVLSFGQRPYGIFVVARKPNLK